MWEWRLHSESLFCQGNEGRERERKGERRKSHRVTRLEVIERSTIRERRGDIHVEGVHEGGRGV
jgi:hypothetical protein